MPDLVCVRLAHGHCPTEDDGIELMIFDIVEKNRPVQLANGGSNAISSELILKREGNTFSNRVAGVNLDFEAKRNSFAIDHFVKHAIAIGIAPTGFFQQFQTLLRIKRVTEQIFVVLRAKEINGALNHYAQSEQHSFNQLSSIAQYSQPI